MDPLSITASAITILNVTTDLISACRNYHKCVKGSTKEVAGLIHELESFDIVLKSLEDISHKTDEQAKQQIWQLGQDDISQQDTSRLPTLQKMLEAGGPLSLCYNEMLVFKRKLTKDHSGLKRSLKWPFRKDEIKAVTSRLRNLKSLLDTAIARDHL